MGINNTEISVIQYIKIISNSMFYCMVCCKINLLGDDSRNKLSNINSHVKTLKHTKQIKIYELTRAELKKLSSVRFPKFIVEHFVINNIPMEKLSACKILNKWIEIITESS